MDSYQLVPLPGWFNSVTADLKPAEETAGTSAFCPIQIWFSMKAGVLKKSCQLVKQKM